MTLTHATAKAISPGEILQDDKVPGLELRGSHRGATWRIYYRTRAGERRRPRIGAFPAISIDAARDLARGILERVARGEDPSAEWAEQRAAPTVADLCESYMAEWARPRKKPRSVHDDHLLITAHVLPGLGKRRVADITISDIDVFLADVKARKFVKPKSGKGRGHRPPAPPKWQPEAPGAANRVRALLSKMFNLAELRFGMRPRGSNPVQGTIKNTEHPRKRHASPAELARIAEAMHDLALEHPLSTAALWCMFYTGARVGEIARARVGDLQGGELVLREHKTDKHIGEKRIHLPPPALAILQGLAVGEADELLFVGESLRYAWDKVRQRAGVPDLQMRDIRRTFASIGVGQGKSLQTIGGVLGHTNAATTQRYAWLMDDPRVQTTEQIAGEVARLMGGDQSKRVP
jgi:integrase